MAGGSSRGLSSEVRGWLRFLWRKAMTPDDWSRAGEPHPWWDRYSLAPMLSFPRFDLSESSYALLLLARKTPAWREVYTEILDQLLRRHTTYWAAVDWLTQIGPDPDRGRYPKAYKRLIPKDLWGRYDAPGWTANGSRALGTPARPDRIAGQPLLSRLLQPDARDPPRGVGRGHLGPAVRGDRPRGPDLRVDAPRDRGLPQPAVGEDSPRSPLREHQVLAVLPLGGRARPPAHRSGARHRAPTGSIAAGSRTCSRRSTWASTRAGT